MIKIHLLQTRYANKYIDQKLYVTTLVEDVEIIVVQHGLAMWRWQGYISSENHNLPRWREGEIEMDIGNPLLTSQLLQRMDHQGCSLHVHSIYERKARHRNITDAHEDFFPADSITPTRIIINHFVQWKPEQT